MLIPSSRHSVADLEAWQRTVRHAELEAQSKRFRNNIRRAAESLSTFTGRGSCYAGCSWGKDSVALAHLIVSNFPSVPIIWVRVEPIKNPDCFLVRDEFLRLYPRTNYHEIEVWCTRDADGWHARGTLERGFSEASRQFGQRHISGIRADESGQRKRRMRTFGESSKNTCAPIGWWTGMHVFAHLESRHLPVHPAYACTLNGLLDPERIRVASLGGKRGDGMGRAEWEWRYYRDELIAIERMGPGDPSPPQIRPPGEKS